MSYEVYVKYEHGNIVRIIIGSPGEYYYITYLNNKSVYGGKHKKKEDISTLEGYEELHVTEYREAIRFLFLGKNNA